MDTISIRITTYDDGYRLEDFEISSLSNNRANLAVPRSQSDYNKVYRTYAFINLAKFLLSGERYDRSATSHRITEKKLPQDLLQEVPGLSSVLIRFKIFYENESNNIFIRIGQRNSDPSTWEVKLESTIELSELRYIVNNLLADIGVISLGTNLTLRNVRDVKQRFLSGFSDNDSHRELNNSYYLLSVCMDLRTLNSHVNVPTIEDLVSRTNLTYQPPVG